MFQSETDCRDKEARMRCGCGCDRFRASQAVRGTVSVIVTVGDNGEAYFETNDTKDGLLDSSELDCDDPEGPFACVNCGNEIKAEDIVRARAEASRQRFGKPATPHGDVLAALAARQDVSDTEDPCPSSDEDEDFVGGPCPGKG